jgi:hypothetical protein
VKKRFKRQEKGNRQKAIGNSEKITTEARRTQRIIGKEKRQRNIGTKAQSEKQAEG